MYTGTVIDELMAVVERAEDHAWFEAELELRRSILSETGVSANIYERVAPAQPAVA